MTSTQVLDHGFVSLIDSMPAVKKWVPFTDTDGSNTPWGAGDARAVQAARVSTGHLPSYLKDKLGIDHDDGSGRPLYKDAALLKYMFNNGHTSPFEKIRFEFCVRAPIFVARQWFRHRTRSFNETSGRYSQLEEMFYIPTIERMQAQHSTNKQMSGEPLDIITAENIQSSMLEASKKAFVEYRSNLAVGLSRELARIILPVNTYTTWYETVDLHNLMGFFKLRLHEHAQWEIREYAKAMVSMAAQVAPYTIWLFREKNSELFPVQ